MNPKNEKSISKLVNYTGNFQLLIHNTKNGNKMKVVNFLKILSLGGRVFHTTRLFQMLLKKTWNFKNFATPIFFCLLR